MAANFILNYGNMYQFVMMFFDRSHVFYILLFLIKLYSFDTAPYKILKPRYFHLPNKLKPNLVEITILYIRKFVKQI